MLQVSEYISNVTLQTRFITVVEEMAQMLLSPVRDRRELYGAAGPCARMELYLASI